MNTLRYGWLGGAAAFAGGAICLSVNAGLHDLIFASAAAGITFSLLFIGAREPES